MPTLRDKKRAVEISHEIQQNISNYLFSVSLINLALGVDVGAGLYFMGVPNAAMWGMLVAVLNFVPYFGPVAGVILLGIVGLLTFDTLGKGLLPSAWYLLFHLLEAELNHSRIAARTPVHAQSRGHFCFLDLLDVALGCTRCFIICCRSCGFPSKSSAIASSPRCRRSANFSPTDSPYFRFLQNMGLGWLRIRFQTSYPVNPRRVTPHGEERAII